MFDNCPPPVKRVGAAGAADSRRQPSNQNGCLSPPARETSFRQFDRRTQLLSDKRGASAQRLIQPNAASTWAATSSSSPVSGKEPHCRERIGRRVICLARSRVKDLADANQPRPCQDR